MALGMLASGVAGAAQPTDAPPPPPSSQQQSQGEKPRSEGPRGEAPFRQRMREGEPQPAPNSPPDLTQIRARLAQRLEETKRIESRLEEAIKRIDSGEPLDAEAIGRLERPGRWLGRGDAPRRDREGDREGGKPAGGRSDDGPMTAEETDRILAFAKENMPKIAERLEELRKINPDAFQSVLRRFRPRVHELAAMAEREPEQFKLKLDEFRSGIQTMETIRQLREKVNAGSGDLAEAKALQAQLRENLGAQYDAQVAVQAYELRQLEDRIARLRATIEERRGKRDSWITERINDFSRFSGREPDRTSEKPARKE